MAEDLCILGAVFGIKTISQVCLLGRGGGYCQPYVFIGEVGRQAVVVLCPRWVGG